LQDSVVLHSAVSSFQQSGVVFVSRLLRPILKRATVFYEIGIHDENRFFGVLYQPL